MNFRVRLQKYFQQDDRAWAISLCVAVCLVYLPFLGNPFIFDDQSFFLSGTASLYGHSWFQLDLRWLPWASLGWTEMLFSNVFTHFFHLGNLLLHFANVILLFILLRHLAGAVTDESEKSRAVVWGAWFGALIFALHPVAVYAVGYVVQRSILMATMFALVMQLAYLRGLLSGQKRWFVLSVFAYFMACFSKEHSVLAPAVLGAMGLLVRTNGRVQWRVMWLTWSAFFAIAVLVILRAKGVIGSPYEPMAAQFFEQQGVEAKAGTPMLHVLSVMTQAGLFFKYLLLWFLPNVAWMSADMREPFVYSFTAWQGWLGAGGFLAYGFVSLRLLLRGGIKGLIGFALLYPWLQFWLEFSSIRVQEPFVLYRSYLWMPGLMLLIPVLLSRFPQRTTLLALGCAAILLIPLGWNRLWVFGDNYRLWNDAALLLKDEKTAGADRIYYNRGQALMSERKWEAAAKDFERSVAISPQLALIHYALGDSYINAKRYQDALTQYDAAISIDSRDGRFYFGKGLALTGLHRNDEARQQMVQSCKLNNAMACFLISLSSTNKR